MGARKITEKDLLLHMEVPRKEGKDKGKRSQIYVLGSFEKRVTLYSQQVRALNLAYSLFKEGCLQKTSKVAVIGAGAAGLTATSGLAALGAHVTLLERKPQILHLFNGCKTRWLHPRVYDWPNEGWSNSSAGLPILDWKAAAAWEVCNQLEAGWQQTIDQFGKQIEVHLDASNVQVVQDNDKPKVNWNKDGFKTGEFDVVILAVGFGIERSSKEFPACNSYWRNDALEQPELEWRENTPKTLVSGTGDGGMVDVLRASLTNFRHDQIAAEIFSNVDTSTLEKKLLDIENELWKQNDDWLYTQYKALSVPKEIDAALRSRMRKDTIVTLNGVSEVAPISAESSILNRFLVSRILGCGLNFRGGRIAGIERSNSGVSVTFEDNQIFRFDQVIVRHGPASALQNDFSKIFGLCNAMSTVNTLDQTRWPIWPDGAFGNSLAPSSNPSPSPKASVNSPGNANVAKTNVSSVQTVTSAAKHQSVQSTTPAHNAASSSKTGAPAAVNWSEIADEIKQLEKLVKESGVPKNEYARFLFLHLRGEGQKFNRWENDFTKSIDKNLVTEIDDGYYEINKSNKRNLKVFEVLEKIEELLSRFDATDENELFDYDLDDADFWFEKMGFKVA